MSERGALIDLRDKVKAGTLESWLDMKRGVGIAPDDRHIHGMNAYNGSLDAAKALHEAVLPGWAVERIVQLLDIDEAGSYSGTASDWIVTLLRIADGFTIESDILECPAHAWLLAIIDALIAKETP
jgi:hypothetical protein